MVDPLTVRFHLNEPYAPFLSNLAYPTGLIVSPTAVETHGADYARNPAGTGPFVFRVWESNRQVALERNDGLLGRRPALGAASSSGRSPTPMPGRRDALGRHRPDGRGAAGQRRAVRRGRRLRALRAGRTASLVPDPQHQGGALRRRADAPGGQLRHRQGNAWSTTCCRARPPWRPDRRPRPSPGPTTRISSPTRTIPTRPRR